METEIHYKNSFIGYYSMGNVDEDSNINSWHHFNALTNGRYYDGFTPRTVADPYLGHDKDELKQVILQHEAVFKNQVYELHRLCRRQRDMMEEVKRNEFHKYQISIDTSYSSSIMPYQKPYQDGDRWQHPSFPLGNSTSRPSIFGAEISNSSLSCNGSKDCEVVACRPSKVRKKLFDLQMRAHEYIEQEERDGGKKNGYTNERVYGKNVDFFGPFAERADIDNLRFEGTSNGRDRVSSCLREPGNSRSNTNHTSQYFENSKLSTPSNTMQHFHGKEIRNRGIYPEISSQIQDHSYYAYPFITTSEIGNSRSQSGSSWGKSNDNLTRKLTLFQPHPSFLASPRNDNGFHNGSTSGSKEPSQKIFNGSNFVDLTDSTKYMDLNTVQALSNEDEISRKCDETVPFWLKSKPVICKKGDCLDDVANEKDESGVSNSASIEHRGIDINVAWEEETDEEFKNFKNRFDLNSCLTEDDDDLFVTESVKSSKTPTMEIDLETEPKPDHTESEKIAAEAIVAISSQQDHDNNNDKFDVLLWFVEVINSCKKNITDEYEMLTLQLEETKEEDYMPTSPVPDFQEPDDVALTSSRPRRGQSRRGRPRRDFQRDILPGMTSLSRHEITEDLQIFGGLMRATGYSWNYGSTKKKGKRIRKVKTAVEITPATTAAPPPLPPPASEQVNNGEVRLTGWGKTTRRPRRQRCAAGNSVVAVQLT